MSPTIRLARELPVARQAGCATAIGVGLTVTGGATLAVARAVAERGDQSPPLVYVIGAGFLFVGVVMSFFALKLSLMSRLPQTIVEVDRLPVRPGESFRLSVRQPGPIRLRSLRANLVGEQVTKRVVWSRGRRRVETDRHPIHQANIVDMRDLTVARGEEVVRQGEATVPVRVELVDIVGDKTVVWRIEVWGRVRGWVNFGHPFSLAVRPGALGNRNPLL